MSITRIIPELIQQEPTMTECAAIPIGTVFFGQLEHRNGWRSSFSLYLTTSNGYCKLTTDRRCGLEYQRSPSDTATGNSVVGVYDYRPVDIEITVVRK